MIFLNPEKSVAVVGNTGVGKTAYLSKLVSFLANSKSVCVIEDLNKEIYRNVTNLVLDEVASFELNTIEQIRDSGAAINFIHLPAPSRTQLNEKNQIFKISLIHHLLTAYDVIVIDETSHTMSELIRSDLFTDFLLACNKEGILVVFSGFKLDLIKMVPEGKQYLLDYVLELEEHQVKVHQDRRRTTKLHDVGLYYDKLRSFTNRPNAHGSSIGSRVGNLAGAALGGNMNSSHSNCSTGEENGVYETPGEEFVMDLLKFTGELLIWGSSQDGWVREQSNSIIDKAIEEFEKITGSQAVDGNFDALLKCFKQKATQTDNSLGFQQFLKSLEPLFTPNK